jgi:Sec-independent protein secretion pathway component TatC
MLSSRGAKAGGTIVFIVGAIIGFPNPFGMFVLGMVFIVLYTIGWFALDWLRETMRPRSSLPPLPTEPKDHPDS